MIELRESEAATAPLPQLNGTGSTEAILATRDARALCLFWILVSTLTALIAFALLYNDAVAKSELPIRLAVFSFAIVIFAVNSWQFYGLGLSRKSAWKAQIWISVLGLALFPFGTLVYGYVLARWFRPDVKEWFRVYDASWVV